MIFPRLSYLWQYVEMTQTFGIETPKENAPTPHQEPVRYLVVIDSGGSMVARLFLDTREMVAEFDAAAEEVTAMTSGLVPEVGALGSEWDQALLGHSADERSAAKVYTLDI